MMLQKKKPVVMQLNDLSVYRTELMKMVSHCNVFQNRRTLSRLKEYSFSGTAKGILLQKLWRMIQRIATPRRIEHSFFVILKNLN